MTQAPVNPLYHSTPSTPIHGAANNMDQHTTTESSGNPIVKALPFLAIIGVLALVYFSGAYKFLTLEALREHIGWLDAQVATNFFLVFAAYIALYAAATAFMVPGGILTIAGGALFGVTLGVPLFGSVATVMGATLGASILFFVAKTSLGASLRQIAGPFVEKMEGEFRQSPLSYMFLLRLVPAMPFAVANIAPALLGAKYRDYLLTTALGIIPGTVAYSWIGAGVAELVRDPSVSLDDSSAVVNSLIDKVAPAFIALFVVALIPVAYNRFFKKKPAQPSDNT
ncbi:MAG: VTT domain-containing protein [Pseudomonadota bacterium]